MQTRSKKWVSVRVGWASAHLIMKCVYPPPPIKVVTQAFVCPELSACFRSQPASPVAIHSHCLHGWLPSQIGAGSNFLGRKKTFITAFVMDTPQIFPQQMQGFLMKGWWTWEAGLQNNCWRACRVIGWNMSVKKWGRGKSTNHGVTWRCKTCLLFLCDRQLELALKCYIKRLQPSNQTTYIYSPRSMILFVKSITLYCSL